MFRLFLRRIRRFRREERGVVLILVVLIIVPLLLVIAVGIDYGNILIVKRQLSSGVDAAALAIGSDPEISNADAQSKAEAFINAHYAGEGLQTPIVTRSYDENQNIVIDISATAQIPTHFMRIGGVENLTVTVNSQVVRRNRDLEVVMVLDNSGSMGHAGKMNAMQKAAKSLVEALFDATEAEITASPGAVTSDDVRIGLVPFTGAVNVGVPASTSWLDHTYPAARNADIFDPLAFGQSAFSVLNSMGTVTDGIDEWWGGCVMSRTDGLDLTDTPPSETLINGLVEPPADPALTRTLFTAYFHNYIPNPHSMYEPNTPPRTNPASYVGDTSFSQNRYCPQAAIQPLTNDAGTIVNAINAMTANGATNIPEGMAWGWRVLSAAAPFSQGVSYDDKNTIKALIVLTDGDNDVDGIFSSYGFNQSNSELDSYTETICENIKADLNGWDDGEDIVLFTIVFDVLPGSSLETRMSNCASDSPHFQTFYNSPNNQTLKSHFRQIAASLNQLRIAQ